MWFAEIPSDVPSAFTPDPVYVAMRRRLFRLPLPIMERRAATVVGLSKSMPCIRGPPRRLPTHGRASPAVACTHCSAASSRGRSPPLRLRCIWHDDHWANLVLRPTLQVSPLTGALADLSSGLTLAGTACRRPPTQSRTTRAADRNGLLSLPL